MKMLFNITKVLLIGLASATVFLGCIEETDEVPKVVAGFTFTVTEAGTVTFLNTSERATRYAWDFGDGKSSTEINPVKSYVAGTYIVSLTASNTAGASNIFKDTINVIIKDKIKLPVTFDETNTDYEVTTFNGASFAIVDNPSPGGTNSTASKVGAITNSGVAYEGIFMDFETQIDLATKKTITINFLANAPVPVLLKLEEGTSGPVETTVTHGGTGWEKLSFNFTSSAKYSRLTLFVDGPGTTAGTFHIDNIDQEVTPIPTSPPTPAPTPPARAAGDVISIFSGAYTNISGVDTNPNWGQATVTTTIDISGNATLKYENLNYQGTDWAGNAQNVSAMGFLHVDFWTINSTALNVFIISPGSEKAKALTVPTGGNWTSVDIPLTDFAPPVNLSNVIQFKFDGNGTIFLDNLYFYKTGGGATVPTTAAPTPPARAAGDVISIFSGAYSNISGVDTNPNWGQATVTTTIDIAGNATLKYTGLNYQGTDWSGNAQNVSAMTHLHVDYWTANSTALNVSVISSGPVEKAKALTVPTGGNWTSVDIPLTDFAPPVNLSNVIQFKFDGNGDIYLDNLYFYKPAGGGGGGSNIAVNGTFETGTDSGWQRFQNGGTAVLDNTVSNGGTWSGKLATAVAPPGSNPAFKQERIGVGTVAAGKTVQISFDHKGTVVQPGAVFNVILFGEGASGASFTHVFNPAPSLGANWTTFTGSFAIPGGTDVSQGVSVLIEAVCGGDTGCSVTANIDNVTVTVN